MQYVACEKSTDRVWFVMIIERCEADQPYTDDMAFQLQKANNFSVENIWTKLAKQDIKHLSKK